MARPAALAVGACIDRVHRKAAVAQLAAEARIGAGRPDGKNAARAQRFARRSQAVEIIKPIIGFAGQPVRPIVDIEQDCVEARFH
ncbi:hypothetical protein AJ87_42730 [Rhizobium yanglingense]|nr:hypothetical protein AJ87_42730 [Rhizobium yanglingense]